MNAVDAITPAFEHAKAQLFRPFRRGQWLRLGLLGLATGELGSSGGCNIQVPANWSRGGASGSQHLLAAIPPWIPPMRGALAIAVLAACIVALAMVMMYVGSVCRFILFETVLTRHCALRAGWRRWQQQGLQLFGFSLLLFFGFAAGLAILVGLPVLLAWRSSFVLHRAEHLALFVAGIALLVMIAFALGVAVALVHVFTKDFVVPQMALENVGIFDGWRRLWPRVNVEGARFAGYVGMKIVLAIAAGIMLGIAGLIVILPVVTAGAIIAVIVAFVVKPVGFVWTAGIIALAVTVGAVVLVALIFLVAVLGSPITVFFPSYAMYFFAGRYPPLAERLFPRPPEPPPVFSPPIVPPIAPPDIAPAT